MCGTQSIRGFYGGKKGGMASLATHGQQLANGSKANCYRQLGLFDPRNATAVQEGRERGGASKGMDDHGSPSQAVARALEAARDPCQLVR